MKSRFAFVLLGFSWLCCTYSPAVADGNSTVSIVVKDTSLDFLAGTDLVGRYNKAPSAAKPYFWPLNGPGQLPLTRAWPMVEKTADGTTDHIHQKSFWFCHGDVIPEGIEHAKIKGVAGVDFWSEAKGHGRIVCVYVDEPKVGKNQARVTTKNEWQTSDGTKILDETRTIHLYVDANRRLFVFDIDLAASVVPITFGDTKEGSFGVRVHDALREAKGSGRMTNAEGNTGEKACWGRLSAWCDYSGTIDGKAGGIAIFDDPNNPYPACWHIRGYGLMAANPFGRGGHSGFPAMKGKTELAKLAKGDHLKLRYGLLLHAGNCETGRVAEQFERFKQLRNQD